MLSDVVSAMDIKSEKPVIVMDAGIATEENLEIIKSEKNINTSILAISSKRGRDWKWNVLSPKDTLRLRLYIKYLC